MKIVSIITAAVITLGFVASCVPVENQAPQSIVQVEDNSVVDPILAQRRTINPFLAWNVREGRTGNRYGLAWTAEPYRNRYSQSQPLIRLNEIYWAYHYTNAPWSYYPGIESHLTDRLWTRGSAGTGQRYVTRINDPEFITFIAHAAVDKAKATGSHGVLLDWWHDNHSGSNGYPEGTVRRARQNLVAALREVGGNDYLIFGNVNWRRDTATASQLNGVFLELYKTRSSIRMNDLYTRQELLNMESLLQYYERTLAYPRLIALEGWRQTTALTDADRNTPANRRMAKIMTAMSVVIPTHGYILYGDNNADTPEGDHFHLYYDFYSFDVGRPTSDYQQVSRGVGFKEHDRGVVAYNITGRDVVIETSDGREIIAPANSGLFCEYVGDTERCLTAD